MVRILPTLFLKHISACDIEYKILRAGIFWQVYGVDAELKELREDL